MMWFEKRIGNILTPEHSSRVFYVLEDLVVVGDLDWVEDILVQHLWDAMA